VGHNTKGIATFVTPMSDGASRVTVRSIHAMTRRTINADVQTDTGAPGVLKIKNKSSHDGLEGLT
jgi:hypothetical protein